MNSWSYPFPTQQIALNDSLTINYVDEGQGSHTLVFVHGLGSNLKAWQKNIDALSKSYRCIALDLPNYGQSSQGDYPFGMSYFAEVLKSFLDKLNLEKVVLVGHSMGGQTAIHFALDYPEMLSHLILMAPAGFETFTPQQIQWFEQVYTKAFVQSATEVQIRKNFHLNFFDMPEDAQFMISDRLEMRADSSAYDSYCAMIPKCVIGMLKEPIFA
ncbi:MAG: alpha/beta hydrolase, partial [Saprospiraceae bacterium]|nr:alpha/beta hydrolase [Saprospiraceae bacterium]